MKRRGFCEILSLCMGCDIPAARKVCVFGHGHIVAVLNACPLFQPENLKKKEIGLILTRAVDIQDVQVNTDLLISNTRNLRHELIRKQLKDKLEFNFQYL